MFSKQSTTESHDSSPLAFIKGDRTRDQELGSPNEVGAIAAGEAVDERAPSRHVRMDKIHVSLDNSIHLRRCLRPAGTSSTTSSYSTVIASDEEKFVLPKVDEFGY